MEENREKKVLGSLICTMEGPSPSSFSFVVTADGETPIRRGQFVTLGSEEGKMIAFVTNVVKTNRYFMRADSVKEYEKGGTPLTSIFPADRWEYLIAEAITVGIQNGKGLERVSFPPSPGQKVYEVDGETLANFLGLDMKDGLDIGGLKYHDLQIKLNLNRLLRKHVAVLSKSGGGKSYFTSVLLEELLGRKPQQGRLGVVVVDVHGEYTSFAYPGGEFDYSDRTAVVRGRDIKIGVPHLNAYAIREFVPDMSEPQVRELQRILSGLKAEMNAGKGPFGLEEVIAKAGENGESHKQMRQALVGWLYGLQSLRLFDKVDRPSWNGLIAPGRAVILDLSDVISLRKKQILVTYISRKLFNLRRQDRIPPVLLCVEEAHQFCPTESAISKNVIEMIAREGRKFYFSLLLISQRPVRLSTTALSQMNTNVILRVTNPYDLEHIKQSSEAITTDVAQMISSLPVGEALVVGEAVNHPIFVKVRGRRSKEPSHGAPMEEIAREFEGRSNRELHDAKAFM